MAWMLKPCGSQPCGQRGVDRRDSGHGEHRCMPTSLIQARSDTVGRQVLRVAQQSQRAGQDSTSHCICRHIHPWANCPAVLMSLPLTGRDRDERSPECSNEHVCQQFTLISITGEVRSEAGCTGLENTSYESERLWCGEWVEHEGGDVPHRRGGLG